MALNVLKNKLEEILNPIIPRYEKRTGKVLFENYDNTGKGSKTITLNDDIENYKFIEVCYCINENIFNTRKIYINKKTSLISSIEDYYIDSNGVWCNIANIKIDKTSVTFIGSANFCVYANAVKDFTKANVFWVHKIIGYKE